MDNFTALSNEDKKAVFEQAATKHGVLPIIIEKDFWVCWTLKQIFGFDDLGQYLTFKGGTSLSKAFKLIDRFSEDIDITISKTAPFINDLPDAMANDISGKERERRIDALKSGAQKFVAEIALPTLDKLFKAKLDNGEWKLVIDSEDKDKQTILFYYPFIFSDGNWDTSRWDELEWDSSGYIRAIIKL